MNYTVSSRGRPIGVTDLGFIRLVDRSRSGWFHPNAEGHDLMPRLASCLPAMRAYLHRDVRGADGLQIVQQRLMRSALFGDLAESFHHIEAMELTLHHADGSLIPTELIGIQDSERLIAMAEWDDGHDVDEWSSESILIDPNEDLDDIDDLEDIVELGPEAYLGYPQHDSEPDDAWLTDFDWPTFPRYQIHVMLIDEAAIP